MNPLGAAALYGLAAVGGAYGLAVSIMVFAYVCEVILLWWRRRHAEAEEALEEARPAPVPCPSADYVDACTICLDDFPAENGARTRTLDCHHRFHLECIRAWRRTLEGRCEVAMCPLCRAPFSRRKMRRSSKR